MSGYIKLSSDSVWLLSTGPVARVIEAAQRLADERGLTAIQHIMEEGFHTHVVDLTRCDETQRQILLALLPDAVAAARSEPDFPPDYESQMTRLIEMIRRQSKTGP